MAVMASVPVLMIPWKPEMRSLKLVLPLLELGPSRGTPFMGLIAFATVVRALDCWVILLMVVTIWSAVTARFWMGLAEMAAARRATTGVKREEKCILENWLQEWFLRSREVVVMKNLVGGVDDEKQVASWPVFYISISRRAIVSMPLLK